MRVVWMIIIAIVIAAAVYIFYARQQVQAPESGEIFSPPDSTFQGPPPGSVPFVKGPTGPPPGASY